MGFSWLLKRKFWPSCNNLFLYLLKLGAGARAVIRALIQLTWFYCRTNTLLEKVALAVDQSAFYSALWGSLLTSPAVRLPGITYVLSHLNRKLSMEDQLYIIGSDIELMVMFSWNNEDVGVIYITVSFGGLDVFSIFVHSLWRDKNAQLFIIAPVKLMFLCMIKVLQSWVNVSELLMFYIKLSIHDTLQLKVVEFCCCIFEK